tara:strand:+ start:1365 stop:2120 length:756 start_codon:yes stop_codon:yes gene_type:complete
MAAKRTKNIKVKNKQPKKKKKKPYFGKDAHQAVVDYQNAETREEKNTIYNEKIKPSFEKLAENLIFIHGFAASDYSLVEILKNDCVSFLYETLEKFDPTRKTKAFSYFNVVAKNWLIIQSKKRIKNRNRHVSMSNMSVLSRADKSSIENYQIIPSQETLMIMKQNREMLDVLLVKIKNRLSNQNEIACVNAIITLFAKIEELDFLNKRAVFVYMRELSNLTPKQLSVAMSNIRKHYKEIVKSNDDFNVFIT